MSTLSPPKPWERAGAASSTTTTSTTPSTMLAPAASTNTNTAIGDPPALPDRPSGLNSVVNQTASNYSPYGQSRFGATTASPYSGYGGGGYSNYSSPYSRFGGMNSMYGGMGGYSSMYGGMGGGYGGYGGGMYGGMPGEDPNNPSLTQSFNQSTQATFQIIESLVGAFGGFAQMLESTYMATRSSFFAMVSVAEQFGTLRNTLGSVLGIFTILRWLRTLLAKITGRPPPADATSLTPANFSSFLSGTSASGGPPATLPDGSPAPPRPSKKPFIMFALAVVGLPYLMSKLIKALARSQEAEAQQRLLQQQQNPNLPPFDPNNPQATGPAALDPTKLAFCRALYDYTPDPQLPQPSFDLTVKKGDLVAVLSQTDPLGNPSQWWRCRARDGKMGYLPAPYLETVKRPDAQRQITAAGEVSASAPGSRTTTLRGSDGAGGIGGVADADGGRTKSLDSAVGVAGKPEVKGRPGDISAESFQKSAFYSG